jgi:uncharacterized integral membrane protein
MQIFLFGALALSLLAVVFALQNIVPVTVTFMNVQFEGSLALVLFVAFVAGALVSFLASVPTLVKGRWAGHDLRRRVAELEAGLAQRQQQLHTAEDRLRQALPRPAGPDRSTPPHEGGRTGAPLEPKA